MQKESGHQQDVILPEVFDEHEAEPTVKTAIHRITEGKALEGWIEYLNRSGILIISQYRQSHKGAESSLLNNILSVYDLKNEKTVYNEIIAEDLKTPSPDSFFRKNDLLFFIKHQTMLTALQVWNS
jgi:hypothetical protein